MAETGQKNRKYGRGLRSLSHQRYINEDRKMTNKIRKMQKRANRTGESIKFKVGGEWKKITPQGD